MHDLEKYIGNIKMIALDLDGTTLNGEGKLTEKTKAALRMANDKGVSLVVATGRCFDALPEDIKKSREIGYLVTSNGAKIWDRKKGEDIYSNCIDEKAVVKICQILSNYDYTVEAFVGGKAYMDSKDYDGAKEGRTGHRRQEYILNTRNPIDGILDFAIKNKRDVENFNVVFEKQADKMAIRSVLENIENTTFTSSFDSNWELGGKTTGKGDAMKFLKEELGIDKEEIMCFGDSPNDISMIELAGLGVAMGNGKEEVKKAAKYITKSNDEDGVAYAIEKFA